MWWRDGVVYQIYIRSFADSNGDGIGDLPGVIGRLDHLASLGVDAIWLSPVHPSPDTDWGYDVADYLGVHPELGTMEDLDRLIAEADTHGIRVLLDLVPNHTSDQHPWFVDSRSARDARQRDWYVWADPKPDGSPPNNWVANFLGSAWTFDETTGQYYLHQFLPTQADLNWWNEEVREAFDRIQRFWFDRGVAGFRIDVCHSVVKDRELRDNPPCSDDDPFDVRLLGQRQLYNAHRPELHDVLRRWRRVADTYDPPRLLLGETYFWDLDKLPDYYGDDDELHLAFNIPFIFAPLEAEALRANIEAIERSYPPHAWPVWTGSNHDVGRLATRWCDGDPDRIRCALLMLLTLRGTPVLYQGDEIGLPNTQLTEDQLRDPLGIRYWPAYPGRDPGRTPMHWTGEPEAGFTRPGVTPWLPLGDTAACNVADQESDPGSILNLCRDLVGLRRRNDDLRRGAYRTLPTPDGMWSFGRGAGTMIALNLSSEPRTLDGVDGEVVICTRRDRDGERVAGRLALEPWQGAVVTVT